MNRSPYQYPTLNPVWTIIGVNVLVFLFTLIKPTETTQLLGLNPSSVSQHPWTLITSIFVHDYRNFGHIFANMVTLYFFGSYLLSMLGDRKFLLVYFGGGLLGSIMFILLAPLTGDVFATVIGASGAVFSVGGALAVLTPNSRVFVFFFLPLPLWVAVLIGFLIISPGVAWQAHLGGLAFGLAAGYSFRRGQRRQIRW